VGAAAPADPARCAASSEAIAHEVGEACHPGVLHPLPSLPHFWSAAECLTRIGERWGVRWLIYNPLLFINEQPQTYWIDKFQAEGMTYDERLSAQVADGFRREGVPSGWLADNVMVFAPAID
jgi:hypothetical protein